METIFYTEELLQEQLSLLRRKKRRLLIATALYILLTAGICLLLDRQNRHACTAGCGLISSAYFSWLLYSLSFDLKKEKNFERLIRQLLTGKRRCVTGILRRIECRNEELQPVWHMELDQEDHKTVFCQIPSRIYDPSALEGAQVNVTLQGGQVVGLEVLS